MQLINPRIAIVADWLIDFGWAELVISHLLELFPEADIYTSVCFMDHPMLKWRRVYTSWLQKIPFFNRRHKLAGILRPFAFRSFDLSGYDIIFSSSSAEAKNAGYTKRWKGIKHFCYCHTPTRYYWSHYTEYRNMMEFGFFNPLARFVLDRLINWLRKLDYAAAQKVDYFVANSENTRERIQKYYNRDSEVIYPGVNIPAMPVIWEKWDYYIGVGRCIPYKRFDLLVDAFNENDKKLILCTATDTPLFRELKEKSKPNIEWKYRVSNTEKDALMAGAKAFLFPPEEDFWLVPIEAMALGTPVIAYGKWWALETVIDGKTGVFFSPQTPEALNKAIEEFENMSFDSKVVREHAEGFSKEVFQEKILEYIQSHAK
jgi:glycosyltransferase involved in cell wall biosynthesis